MEPAGTDDEGVSRRVALRAREIVRRGPAALESLVSPEALGRLSEGERLRVRKRLRVELYAAASILADGAVRRALDQRPAYPPYGLVRSMHSQMRLVLANPGPVEEGTVTTFLALGHAYVDTTVFHLRQHYTEQRAEDSVWLLDRLERLLAVFRAGADADTQARLRDGLSFLYGGLQFGTSVCVQLVEAMAHHLEASGLDPADKAEVLARSSRPAFHLAAVNVAHVVPAHTSLLAPAAGPGARWMDPERFVVQEVDGRPNRVALRDEEFPGLDAIPTTYPTLGCPARVSPSGGTSAIGLLWGWCAELARDLGLLGG